MFCELIPVPGYEQESQGADQLFIAGNEATYWAKDMEEGEVVLDELHFKEFNIQIESDGVRLKILTKGIHDRLVCQGREQNAPRCDVLTTEDNAQKWRCNILINFHFFLRLSIYLNFLIISFSQG